MCMCMRIYKRRLYTYVWVIFPVFLHRGHSVSVGFHASLVIKQVIVQLSTPDIT